MAPPSVSAPGSPSSTACSAAGSCPVRCSSSAASPASGSRRCCSRSRAASPRRTAPCSTRPARSPPGSSDCVRPDSASAQDRPRTRSWSSRRARSARSSRRLGTRRPALVVVDSIQTMTVDELDGPAGSVGQVRESALRLMELAKGEGIAVVLVGHVTKDGSIAGPRTLEHLVDAVIDLGGERGGVMRLVRASKNRFGSTDELGVFEMGESGLREVADPGRAFLADHVGAAPGERRRGHAGGQPAAAHRGPGARLAGRLFDAGPSRVGDRSDATRAAHRGPRPARRRRASAPTTSTRISPEA